MNTFILSLFDAFHAEKISYCHFKSNNNLEAALCGVDDLDLLVAQSDRDSFIEIISSRGFRMVHDRGDKPTPFVFHFFGVDPKTGLFVHLHVYFRIITGGSILKNHWIRVENMFLESAQPRGVNGVYIPSAEADLILFVFRKFIEQPSLIEHYLFLKDWPNIKNELDWLVEQISVTEIHRLLDHWFPFVPTALFDKCLGALCDESSISTRVMLGLKIRKRMQVTVYSSSKASLRRGMMFFGAHARGRLGLMRNNRTLFPGGLLVSFVGSEASGKSTSSREAVKWLAERFDVSHIHVGKPKKNWRTKPFWFAIGIYSRLKSWAKQKKPTTQSSTKELARISANLPNPIICVLDSFDRKFWLKKHYSRMMEGGIVVTDRYPSLSGNGLDGPRIEPNTGYKSLLSRIERANYAMLPSPDIVFKMIAPLETTLERNALRDSPEPEPFVRGRFELAKKLNFPQTTVVEIDTTANQETTILMIKNCIWAVKDLRA